MNKVAVVAVCNFQNLPNGGEVFLLNNLFSSMCSEKNDYYLIGMSFDRNDTVGQWKTVLIGDKTYNFLPVAKVIKDKEKTIIPFRFRMVYGLSKYKNRIKEKKFDIVYVHSAELGLPFWNSKEYKIVYHVHGDPSQTLRYSRFSLFRLDFFTKIYLTLINKTIKCSQKVVWAANRSKEQYEMVSPKMVETIEKKSVTVHSSFDRKLCVNYESIPHLVERIHLITVSRLAKIKHVDFMIRSVKKLVQKGNDIDLLVCGDGEEINELKELARSLDISDRIIFLGLCNREQIATGLVSADVFLFASESEAMSLVVLESLYMGTPVVSTDVGDITDVVIDGKTGYTIKEYDLEAYINSIEKILQNGKKHYTENCRNVVQKHTPEFMAANIDKELYDVK